MHASFVQLLLSSQPALSPTLHLPSAHAPSLQVASSAQVALLSVAVQPTAGSQTSSLQGLPSSQSLEPPPWQMELLQVSLAVQALPSSHGLLLGLARHAPVLASHLSSVQGLLSSQFLAGPAAHLPASFPEVMQRSPLVQASPSSQVTLVPEKY